MLLFKKWKVPAKINKFALTFSEFCATHPTSVTHLSWQQSVGWQFKEATNFSPSHCLRHCRSTCRRFRWWTTTTLLLVATVAAATATMPAPDFAIAVVPVRFCLRMPINDRQRPTNRCSSSGSVHVRHPTVAAISLVQCWHSERADVLTLIDILVRSNLTLYAHRNRNAWVCVKSKSCF